MPLAVRWGARVEGGRVVDDFVNLCDFAPTFLVAAGLRPAAGMTGESLLPLLLSGEGGQVDPGRDHVLTGMEQHVYPNPSRALRTADFLYIRNFDPAGWRTGETDGGRAEFDFAEQPWPTVPGAFSYNIDPSPAKQFLRLQRDEPGVKPVAALSFGRRPREELYDLSADPDQLRNVASDDRYADRLSALRGRLEAELRKAGDPRFAKR